MTEWTSKLAQGAARQDCSALHDVFELKGKTETMELYEIFDGDSSEQRELKKITQIE